jgi:hypothetical protein
MGRTGTQIHEFCAFSALMISQAAGAMPACRAGCGRAAESLMNPELSKCIVNQPG